ncbi:MAG: nitrate reductase [Gammaproteobacteria bacterium]|nr:nitrate reductase [Gammaproteobacteria bacterium]MDH4314150.1 nitrate reductase [Gammaproteobacteria bacterium]MDH5212790.1 nitrate reductase [Gammaproteobacteria bacterium]MDH5499980.1 nitrate reductase [Gammaproteobacteria bacterium]
MTLLDFARGPALQWSMIILVAGVLWRLGGTILINAKKDLSKARKEHAVADGLKTIATRSLPAHQFEKNIRFQHFSGYAWHIALFVSVLFFAPHILFFESVLGFGWPSLPNSIILITAAIALAILFALLIRRATHPVQRIISNADDYISILVVIAPLITGILAFAHLGARYETLLAVHLLSVEALFVWFPFGKLMHTALTFPSRYQAGSSYGRKGVRA